MVGMTDIKYKVTLRSISFRFSVDFRHQRACGIYDLQSTFSRLIIKIWRTTMSTKDYHGALRHQAKIFHKNNPPFFKILHDVIIVHNLMPNIEWWSVLFQQYVN